jgi:hypothetical protein
MRLIDANKFQETLDKAWNEPDYMHEGEDWRDGLSLAGCLLDNEPTVDSFEEQNKKFYDFVDFLGKQVRTLHDGCVIGSYKEALEDLSFEICKYLDKQGIPLNRTPLTAEYLDSKYHRDILRGETNEDI